MPWRNWEHNCLSLSWDSTAAKTRDVLSILPRLLTAKVKQYLVQYFSGQTDAFPKACGSFVRMKDDNSKIAADCNQWSNKQWGYFQGKKRYRAVASVPKKYRWALLSSRYECDDSIHNDGKYFGLSTGDFWRVFVR